MTEHKRRKRKEGLTLIEVMLSVVIVGIGLTVMITTASRCLAVARQAKVYQDARMLIGRVELEHRIDREEIEEGSEQGTFTGKFHTYKWSRSITAIGEEDDEPIFEIITRVYWSQQNRKRFEEVVTFLYAPESLEDDI